MFGDYFRLDYFRTVGVCMAFFKLNIRENTCVCVEGALLRYQTEWKTLGGKMKQSIVGKITSPDRCNNIQVSVGLNPFFLALVLM